MPSSAKDWDSCLWIVTTSGVFALHGAGGVPVTTHADWFVAGFSWGFCAPIQPKQPLGFQIAPKFKQVSDWFCTFHNKIYLCYKNITQFDRIYIAETFFWKCYMDYYFHSGLYQ